jgi:hypothetical protein
MSQPCQFSQSSATFAARPARSAGHPAVVLTSRLHPPAVSAAPTRAPPPPSFHFSFCILHFPPLRRRQANSCFSQINFVFSNPCFGEKTPPDRPFKRGFLRSRHPIFDPHFVPTVGTRFSRPMLYWLMNAQTASNAAALDRPPRLGPPAVPSAFLHSAFCILHFLPLQLRLVAVSCTKLQPVALPTGRGGTNLSMNDLQPGRRLAMLERMI